MGINKRDRRVFLTVGVPLRNSFLRSLFKKRGRLTFLMPAGRVV